MFSFNSSTGWPVVVMLLLLSCNNAGSKTAVQYSSVNFSADTTFQIKGISIEAPPKPIGTNAMAKITAVNANWISLTPYAFCKKNDATVYFGNTHQWWGETKEGIAGCVKLAREQHLKIMMKPHLWLADGEYTGHLKMADDKSWIKWEAGYRDYILYFATLADSLQVEMFCLGTELGYSVKERPQFWSALIDTVKKIYKGKLTYAANWDDYMQFSCWQKLDYIGVDAYFPLTGAATPSVDKIERAWAKYINQLQTFGEAKSMPVLFTEYGWRSADKCAGEPWLENIQTVNEAAQANAYAGFYKSFTNKKWFKGGFVWKWYSGENNNPHSKADFTPQAKPALKIIQSFYGAR